MKHKFLIAVIIFVLAGLFFIAKNPTKLVGDELMVSTFTSGGVPTGKLLVQVPFVRTLKTRTTIDISLDMDSDGAFSENENLVKAQV